MTRAIRTCSDAPAEVLATVAVTGADRRSGQNDAVDAGAIRGSQQRSKIMRVLDAIESKEEPVLSRLRWRQQVLNRQEPPLPNDRQYALMRVRSGEPGELVPGLEGHSDTGRSAEFDEPFQAIVSTLPSHADMVKLPGTRTDGLLDRVETEKNFHTPKSTF